MGCQKLNFILPDPQGRALGAACAQNNESLEVCFNKNPHNNPAEIQTGWIDMFEYMKKENIKPFPVDPATQASSAH